MFAILIILGFILYLSTLIIWDNIPEVKRNPKYFTVIEILKTKDEFLNDLFDLYNERRAFPEEKHKKELFESVSKVKQVMILN